MSGSDTSGAPPTPPAPLTPPNFRAFGIMPRPGQPGAMQFDGKNITDFLDEWNIECDDFGMTAAQRCARFPYYCTTKIKDTVKLLPGYLAPNWTTLQSDVKKLYWPQDKPRNTMAALDKLIKDASSMDLNAYILQYTSITDSLVTKHALSPLDRVARLLDGLTEDLRRKVIRYCTKKTWKLSTQDAGILDPDFDDLKTFILTEAQAEQTMAVYSKERSIREHSAPIDDMVQTVRLEASRTSLTTTPVPPTAVATPVSSTPAPTPAPVSLAPTPALDPIAELTKQFSQLALLIQASMQGNTPSTSSTTNTGAPRYDRPRRCPWCDSFEHGRRDCSDFKKAFTSKRIRLNEQNRVVSTVSGEEIPLMFGKGGMKKIFELTTPTATANNNNITLDTTYGNLGEGSVRITTLDFDNGTRTDEIIDADVNERRRRENEILRRRVRPRVDDEHIIPPPSQEAGTTDDRSQTPNAAPRTTPISTSDSGKKFRLASELNQTVSTSQIGEKIMDTPVQLSMREILAVSTEVSSYLHDQTRKRRIPVDSTPASVPTTTPPTSRPNPKAAAAPIPTAIISSTSMDMKTFYACPSGRAKVNIDDQLNVSALLDDGSEVNMMPRRVFEKINLPIDTEIRWRINAYNSDTELESCGPIGVCHDVSLDIGGVEVKQPVFVVEHSNADLILGRPWARAVRAEFINEDDGSYTVRIKSKDGRRVVQFCAVKAEHERNREFVRNAEDGTVEMDHLKV